MVHWILGVLIMYSEIELREIPSQDYDLEAQTPRLFADLYVFINNSLAAQSDAVFIETVTLHIENLEDMIMNDLSHNRVNQDQVDAIKNQLLVLLQFIHNLINHRNDIADSRVLEREFRAHQRRLLLLVSREPNITQRDTPETEIFYDRIHKALIGIYVTLVIVMVGSMIGLVLNNGRNHTVTDVLSWSLLVSIIPLSLPIYFLFAAYIAMTICEPCIEYYRDNMPENTRLAESRVINTSLLSFFIQQKPRSLDDFRRDPNLIPKNIRDIALKLWLAYIINIELLSSTDLQPVLAEYAQYLDSRNIKFEQQISENFVEKLLSFYVEPGRQQLRSAIFSTDEITPETTVLEAVNLVIESNHLMCL